VKEQITVVEDLVITKKILPETLHFRTPGPKAILSGMPDIQDST